MWKKDLKLHHNLSLTITDKTSYDIPTLALGGSKPKTTIQWLKEKKTS